MTTKATFNEDKVALLLGSIIFILALGKFVGIDALGWALKMGMWVGDPIKCRSSASKIIPGVGALFAT